MKNVFGVMINIFCINIFFTYLQIIHLTFIHWSCLSINKILNAAKCKLKYTLKQAPMYALEIFVTNSVERIRICAERRPNVEILRESSGRGGSAGAVLRAGNGA